MTDNKDMREAFKRAGHGEWESEPVDINIIIMQSAFKSGYQQGYQEGQNQWHPIETCPQDKAMVLLFNDETNDYGVRIIVDGKYFDSNGRSTQDIHCRQEVFTHWKCLGKPKQPD